MEIDTIFDIPAHPLFVHVPVVFTPLAALGLLGIVLRPSWRVRYGWLVAVTALVAAIGAQLAVMSGEALEDRIDKDDEIQRHIDLARTARPLVLVFAGLVLVYVAVPWLGEPNRNRDRATTLLDGDERDEPVLVRRSAPSWARPVVAVLAVASVVFAGLATTWVVRAGHQGSKATWEGTGENQ